MYCSPASGAGTPRGTLREEARRTPAWCPRILPRFRRDVLIGLGPRGRRYPSSASSSIAALIIRDHDRRNGREAGLARRARRAPGFALARQLRDVAAGNPSRRRGRPAIPDRRPQRVRQGLARDPLPVPDLPDARPRGRLQRPGRVRGRGQRRGGRGRRGAGQRRPRPRRSASSPPGSAPPRARPPARPTSTRGTRSRTSSSGRPTGSRTRPRCRSRSARATPTTRCSCTAAWASARPT